MEFPDTDSTNQSEICEDSNRASLRSSKRPKKSGETSCSRCSQLQINREKKRKLLEACGLMKELQDENRIQLENTRKKLDEYEEREKEMAAKLQSLCDEEMACKEKLERKMDKYTKREECLKDSLPKLNQIINQLDRAMDDLLS